MIYLQLAFEFFKTGLFAIGGGAATIPFLAEMTKTYDWFTMEELANMIAIGESTPGPIGVNMATYVGYHTGGIPGALIATLSLALPSFLIILIITKALTRFRSNIYVDAAFYGVRPAVAAMLVLVVYSLLEISVFPENEGIQWIPLVIIVVSFVCMQLPKVKKIHPLLWILIGAFLGIILKL